MTINKLRLAATILAATALAPAAMANLNDTATLYWNTYAPYSYSDGGEFTAVTTGEDFSQYYAPTTKFAVGNQTGFETFCIEAAVYFWPGVTYNYTLSQVDSQGRHLTEGAALLYSEFARGVLANYDYTDALGQRRNDAGLLQSALWNLQGGQNGGGQFPGGGAGNQYWDMAASTLGSTLLNDATGTYGVEILELWDANNNTYQNQLVYDRPVSAPDSGTTFSLLALALAGLAGVSHKMSAGSLVLQPLAHRHRHR